jgi:crossover junction endodeoxyribonuclease RusA
VSQSISFFIPGIPKPGGSKKAFVNRKTGRASVVEASRNSDWRASVAHEGSLAVASPFVGPIWVEFHFVMPRPKSHHGTGKNAGVLKSSAPIWHTSPADTTKLIRSTEDALKSIAWVDDAQIAKQWASKQYGERPGCYITIRRLDVAGEEGE